MNRFVSIFGLSYNYCLATNDLLFDTGEFPSSFLPTTTIVYVCPAVKYLIRIGLVVTPESIKVAPPSNEYRYVPRTPPFAADAVKFTVAVKPALAVTV